jgi:ELWxxDGT repeat protein
MGEDRRRRRVRPLLAACVLLLHTTVASPSTPAGAGAEPSFLRNVDGMLFFATYREQSGGWQLWRSDGTPAGTVMLKDGLGLDVELVALDDRLVFSTRGGLWTSDGTPGGTALVKALPFYPNGIKSVRGGIYFSDGRGQLWKSDLTEVGTTLVRDIPPGFVFHDLTPAAITNAGDTVFFRAVDAAIGTELWKSDGTENGTMPVIDLNPIGGSAPSEFLNVRGTLYFSATDGQSGYELWRSDGTAAGTVRVKDINPTGDAWPMLLRLIGDTIFFSADDGTGPELWKTDGTEAGTTKVADINPGGGSYPNALLNIGGTLYFRADDGQTGVELWKTDGTAEGTMQVADINPTGSSVPANLRNVNGRLFFTADDGVHGEELWRSDGTTAGTELVADLNPGGGSYPHYVVNVDGALFFAADDGTAGTQLWTVNGCGTAGEPCTVMQLPLPDRPPSPYGVPYLVKDLNPGPGDGTPYYMTGVDVRVVPHRGRSGLTLKGGLHGMDLGGLRSGERDVVLQLRAADGPTFCARIPAASLVAGKRGVRFKDPRQSTASAGGVTVLRLDAARNGTVSLSAQGPATRFAAPGAGPLSIRVGFVSPLVGDGGSECAAATAVLRRGKRGLR